MILPIVGEALRCDWLTLRRPNERPEPESVTLLGGLVRPPGGVALFAPGGVKVGGWKWPEWGGEHLELYGEFWRSSAVASLRDVLAEWSEGADSVSVVRVDWCVELSRQWDGDAAAELADVVAFLDELQAWGILGAPRSGWARGLHQNEVGSTATLGVRGRDDGEGARARDPWVRVYVERARHRVRLEVERKGFPGLDPARVIATTGASLACALGVPFGGLDGVERLTGGKVQLSLGRLSSQARGMVCGGIVRRGGEVPAEVEEAFRTIDRACGVPPEESDRRTARWRRKSARA